MSTPLELLPSCTMSTPLRLLPSCTMSTPLRLLPSCTMSTPLRLLPSCTMSTPLELLPSCTMSTPLQGMLVCISCHGVQQRLTYVLLQALTHKYPLAPGWRQTIRKHVLVNDVNTFEFFVNNLVLHSSNSMDRAVTEPARPLTVITRPRRHIISNDY